MPRPAGDGEERARSSCPPVFLKSERRGGATPSKQSPVVSLATGSAPGPGCAAVAVFVAADDSGGPGAGEATTRPFSSLQQWRVVSIWAA